MTGTASTAATPRFSAWSPVVATVAAATGYSAPGWVTAVVWGLAVLIALPFRRFRVVVPLALLTLAAGWLVSFVIRLAESGLVGLFVMK